MNGTTFPSYPGQEQHDNQYQSGTRYGDNNNYGQNQSQNNHWQNQSNEGFQKKPWDGQKKQWDGQKKPWNGQKKNWERPKETDMSLYKPYAATGNRDAPPEIISKFEAIAKKLEALGYTARVGGFEGIEEAVEKATTKNEIHLPWRDFAQKQSKFTFTTDRAMAIAKMFHPTFDTMKKSVQLFLAKNARLVMGDKVNSPALFLLCWTEDGVESIKEKTSRSGFTGHPIAIASAVGIPIFNLGNPSAEQRLNVYLESMKPEQVSSYQT